MRIKPTRKEYQGQEVTIVWQPHLCIHSEKCWRNLPEVFRYKQKPWVDPDGANAERLKAQIRDCPSGALTYLGQPESAGSTAPLTIRVLPNGPLKVEGNFTLSDPKQAEMEQRDANLCRCGASARKPFCDGSHNRIGFSD